MLGWEILVLSLVASGLIVLLVSLLVTGIFEIIYGNKKGVFPLIVFAVIVIILIVCFFDSICIWLFDEV